MSTLLDRFVSSHSGHYEGFEIDGRGKTFSNIGDISRYFVANYFKTGASPQYLVTYKMDNELPFWTCTCPDFVYRQQNDRKMCKHCAAATLLVTDIEHPFIKKFVHEITEQQYTDMSILPIGQPLPIFGRTIYLKCSIDKEAGFISFSLRKWRCYTCGGLDGYTYLKGNQCEHIACYQASLANTLLEKYINEMSFSMFRLERNRQRSRSLAIWQRFE